MDLSKLGYTLKGKFKREVVVFSLDNYAPIGDYCVVLTLDSMRVLDCLKLEMWEVAGVDCLDDDDLLDKTLRELQDV
jgi:hypothetical protein